MNPIPDGSYDTRLDEQTGEVAIIRTVLGTAIREIYDMRPTIDDLQRVRVALETVQAAPDPKEALEDEATRASSIAKALLRPARRLSPTSVAAFVNTLLNVIMVVIMMQGSVAQDRLEMTLSELHRVLELVLEQAS